MFTNFIISQVLSIIVALVLVFGSLTLVLQTGESGIAILAGLTQLVSACACLVVLAYTTSYSALYFVFIISCIITFIMQIFDFQFFLNHVSCFIYINISLYLFRNHLQHQYFPVSRFYTALIVSVSIFVSLVSWIVQVLDLLLILKV